MTWYYTLGCMIWPTSALIQILIGDQNPRITSPIIPSFVKRWEDWGWKWDVQAKTITCFRLRVLESLSVPPQAIPFLYLHQTSYKTAYFPSFITHQKIKNPTPSTPKLPIHVLGPSSSHNCPPWNPKNEKLPLLLVPALPKNSEDCLRDPIRNSSMSFLLMQTPVWVPCTEAKACPHFYRPRSPGSWAVGGCGC